MRVCVTENMKWEVHVQLLSSKLHKVCYITRPLKKVRSPHVKEGLYFVNFHTQEGAWFNSWQAGILKVQVFLYFK
jgi:hypothetical protein